MLVFALFDKKSKNTVLCTFHVSGHRPYVFAACYCCVKRLRPLHTFLQCCPFFPELRKKTSRRMQKYMPKHSLNCTALAKEHSIKAIKQCSGCLCTSALALHILCSMVILCLCNAWLVSWDNVNNALFFVIFLSLLGQALADTKVYFLSLHR